MKIVFATGQTCNQFWIYSNFIADCLENHERMAIWIPDITMPYFPNLRKSDIISYPLYSNILAKWIGNERYLKILSKVFGNKYSITLCRVILNAIPGLVFICSNVGGKNSEFRIKHLNEIKSIYTPNKSITDEVDKIFAMKKKQSDILIGVHMRQGDYRTYANGKYYYTHTDYQLIIETLKKTLSNKRVLFFIACNEKIHPSFDCIKECFSIPNPSSIKDLYGLSNCNYIIGPPSTFSAWASLFGNVPLYFLKTKYDNISIENFFKIEDIWL